MCSQSWRMPNIGKRKKSLPPKCCGSLSWQREGWCLYSIRKIARKGGFVVSFCIVRVAPAVVVTQKITFSKSVGTLALMLCVGGAIFSAISVFIPRSHSEKNSVLFKTNNGRTYHYPEKGRKGRCATVCPNAFALPGFIYVKISLFWSQTTQTF